jgi:DNA repair protein RadA/Sms
MNPKSSLFFCKSCGSESSRWMGFCHACGVNEPLVRSPNNSITSNNNFLTFPKPISTVTLNDIKRIEFNSQELNRVFGGGIVPGSIILMAGEPGIGKSTILLQLANELSTTSNSDDTPILYVSGEESITQIRLRSDRIGVDQNNILISGETSVEHTIQMMDSVQPKLVIIDSIQTIFSESLSSSSGSVQQLRECCRILTSWGKEKDTPIIFSGHVTKEGDIAGPKILEHMVDVVLHLEGDTTGIYRVLRSSKNRFGSSDEIALFEMRANGLINVEDPSSTILSLRSGPSSGSIIAPIIQGSRPMLVEIQALSSNTNSQNPRRLANGIDQGRLLMISAVLSKRTNIPVLNQDIIVNIPGGFRTSEPAIDLPISLAIISSFTGFTPLTDIAAIGEIGLNGELRPVHQMNRRIQEVIRLGIPKILVPSRGEKSQSGEIDIISVSTLNEAIKFLE